MKNENSSVEKSVRESQEAYREMLTGSKDPDYRTEEKKERWLRIPKKYWTNELENLNIYERGVLCTYISHMNKEREAWPSFQTIAKILKINWRTVEKSYTGLIGKGVIQFVGYKRKARHVKII